MRPSREAHAHALASCARGSSRRDWRLSASEPDFEELSHYDRRDADYAGLDQRNHYLRTDHARRDPNHAPSLTVDGTSFALETRSLRCAGREWQGPGGSQSA